MDECYIGFLTDGFYVAPFHPRIRAFFEAHFEPLKK